MALFQPEHIITSLDGAFQSFETALNGERNSAIHKIRKEAFSSFKDQGFPTLKNEEWKYTNVNPILKSGVIESEPHASSITKEDVVPFLIPNLEAETVVLVNGKLDKGLSTISDVNGLTIKGFNEALKEDKSTIEKYFAQYGDYKANAFTALNTAFANDGLFIHIEKGKTIEKPIVILQLTDATKGTAFYQPRQLIVAEQNSEAKILEIQASLGENENFGNVVSEIKVAQEARLEFYKLQNDSENSSLVDTIEVAQEASSLFSCYTLSLNGKVIRNNTNILLDGENIESHMYGLYLLKGTTHVDNHTLADHAKPNCFSNELYKGIMQDKSTGVFNGKVMVRQDAQKTNAFQSNNNLLLSDDASINTKPQLEIFADDVKCSHGATTGQLDEDALYYLRSRGISKEKAKALMVRAFAEDVIQEVKIDPFKKHLEQLIEARLSL